MIGMGIHQKVFGGAESIPVPMDDGQADQSKRTNDGETERDSKRPRAEGEEVASPFLLDPFDPNKISKQITVPSIIEYSSEMEDSVLAYAESLEETDEPCEVPPVPTKYGTSPEARFSAEFHYAIWKEPKSWKLLPPYSVYLHARKEGRF